MAQAKRRIAAAADGDYTDADIDGDVDGIAADAGGTAAGPPLALNPAEAGGHYVDTVVEGANIDFDVEAAAVVDKSSSAKLT